MNDILCWRWASFALPTLRLLDGTRLSPHRQRNQPERTDDHAPPRKQREAVTGHVTQERLHHDDRGDERHHETDRNDSDVTRRHVGAVLVEVVGERADHGWNREEK